MSKPEGTQLAAPLRPLNDDSWVGVIVMRIATLRFKLLLRQRLGWMAVAGGAVSILLSMLFAQVSFLNPEKIFWDFALGASFLLQSLLVIYVGSQLFSDEKNRRTLHLLIASGVPRSAWLIGNGLGIWLAATAMNFVWLLLSYAVSWFSFAHSPVTIAFEAQWVLAAEMLVVTFAGIFFSLWVRAFIAFAATLSAFFLLHSTGSIERIFADRESGHLIDAAGVRTVLWLSKFFPPLEWFDLRVFVGYQDAVPAKTVFTLTALGLLWAGLLAGFSIFKFERMDL